MNDTLARATMVVGASRGLGRGIALAFADSGDSVVAVSRTVGAPADVVGRGEVRVEVADAADANTAAALLSKYNPDSLVIVAGSVPGMAPLQEQSWESFSVNWHADVRIAFTWLQKALLLPLKPGAEIVVVSSAAALKGSPESGGYAGAKATQRFLAQYAQEESGRAGLDLSVTTVLPQMTPFGAVGRSGIQAYAARSGQTEDAYTVQLGTLLTPEMAGISIVKLVRDLTPREAAYLLTSDGLRPLP
jgi:NAD(P)-dependent dehydrogenase (short-subunit alcohol dehydrogenase family)